MRWTSFEQPPTSGFTKNDSIICESQFFYVPLQALHGDKEGRFSVKANDQYRVEFTLTETGDEPIVTICNIMELSNHYK